MTAKSIQVQRYKEIALSLMLGTLAATVVAEVIDPKSRVGTFLFWPQQYITYFLKFGANNPIAPRIVFSLLIVVISALAFTVLRLFRSMAKIVGRRSFILIAVFLPLSCWLVIRHGLVDVLTLTGGAISVVLLIAVVYLGRKAMPFWFWPVLWTGSSGWWAIVICESLDPVNLSGPTISFVAAMLWAFSPCPMPAFERENTA